MLVLTRLTESLRMRSEFSLIRAVSKPPELLSIGSTLISENDATNYSFGLSSSLSSEIYSTNVAVIVALSIPIVESLCSVNVIFSITFSRLIIFSSFTFENDLRCRQSIGMMEKSWIVKHMKLSSINLSSCQQMKSL